MPGRRNNVPADHRKKTGQESWTPILIQKKESSASGGFEKRGLAKGEGDRKRRPMRRPSGDPPNPLETGHGGLRRWSEEN